MLRLSHQKRSSEGNAQPEQRKAPLERDPLKEGSRLIITESALLHPLCLSHELSRRRFPHPDPLCLFRSPPRSGLSGPALVPQELVQLAGPEGDRASGAVAHPLRGRLFPF